MASSRKHTTSQRAQHSKQQSTRVGDIDGPEVVIIGAHESGDGRSHMALRNVLWFASKEERDMLDGDQFFDRVIDGRKVFGAEYISYLD